MQPYSFSPKARWDQPLHGNKQPQEPEDIAEQRIDVLALFQNARIYPRAFIWNRVTYRIKTITYHWQERRGQAIICCFSVSTGADLYQISFNNTSFGWRMDKVIE